MADSREQELQATIDRLARELAQVRKELAEERTGHAMTKASLRREQRRADEEATLARRWEWLARFVWRALRGQD